MTSIEITDADNYRWVVPGEIVPSKHKRHVFAVHKSLAFEAEAWTVTHLATSAALTTGATKELALERAAKLLAESTLQEMHEAEEKAYLLRGDALAHRPIAPCHIIGRQLRAAIAEAETQRV